MLNNNLELKSLEMERHAIRVSLNHSDFHEALADHFLLKKPCKHGYGCNCRDSLAKEILRIYDEVM